MFRTAFVPVASTETAPDGSEARPLLATGGGSMAHFTFPAGEVTPAVRHRRCDELWYVVSGHGRLWRDDGEQSEITALGPEVCLSIPVGTVFQVAVADGSPLVVVGLTMPPWPEEGDAEEADGPWTATIGGSGEHP